MSRKSSTREGDLSVHHSPGAGEARGGGGANPGRDADTPREIPARGWLQVTKRAWKESSEDQVPLLAAGVAFKAFLALFPAVTAAFLLWGLVGDTAQIKDQIDGVAAIPAEARSLVTSQIDAIAANQSAAGWSIVIAVALALFSASSGVQNLMAATNIAYDEKETRGFVKIKGTALVLTVGAIVFVLLGIALIGVVPVVASALGLDGVVGVLVGIVRWVLLLGVVVVALGVVYRVAPDRDAPKVRWLSTGAVVATLLFLLVSVGFSLYVTLAGGSSYAKNYGALAGVVILLMWLWLTSYAILLGAEINAEAEKQTEHDTTVGQPEPMGSRRANAADTTA
ncbi:YihY/virulence factor BrkB family protein [Kineococcus gynurae]|uniref:YihY/virulence factor BrkB family protein n=1 Tax=Kineococcus gynurae TaxID=452979 RepID=A0ABV5LV83_9ACTN